MRDWFRRLMMGRYGVDQLTWVLLALSLVISLCGSIFQIKGLSILCWAVLVVCYLRIFSRNIYARQQENQKLLQFWWKLKNKRANRPSRAIASPRRATPPPAQFLAPSATSRSAWLS